MKKIYFVTIALLIVGGILMTGRFAIQYLGYIFSGGPTHRYLKEMVENYRAKMGQIWIVILEAGECPANVRESLENPPPLVNILVDEKDLPRYFFNWSNYGRPGREFSLVIDRDEINRPKLSFMYTERDVLYARRVITGSREIVSAASVVAAKAGTTGPPDIESREFELAVHVLDPENLAHAGIGGRNQAEDDQ